MDHAQIDAFVTELRDGRLDRRQFLTRASAVGLSAGAAAAIVRTVAGQSASPVASPSPIASPLASPSSGPVTGYAQRSMDRAEFWAAVRAQYPLEAPGQPGGFVIAGESVDLQVLNPILADDYLSGFVTGFMFDYLVTISPLDGFPAPGLADFWERSDDGLTYTFHLNPAATWHDGQPVTADDVVFSFESTLAADSLSPRKFTVETYLAAIRKVDDHTVALEGRDRYATLIENTALLVAIIPRHIWASVPPVEWGADPGTTGQDPRRVIGSGPFTFREWVINDHVTIARRADHWDANVIPAIDEFTVRVLPESSASNQAFQAGEIDIVTVEPSQVDPLRQSMPEATVTSYDTTNFIYYLQQQDPERTPLFVDIPVRQAMLYALDRQLIVERVFLGAAVQAMGTQPVLSVAYRPDQITTIYTYDPARAAELLDAAGWVVGSDGIRAKNGVRFSFECLFAEGFATLTQLLPYLQQAWREVGIEMMPAAVPFGALLDAIDTGNYAMSLLGFSWTVDGSQGDMYRCDAVPPNGFNNMNYCNLRFDELDTAQSKELDEARRIELLVEASNVINDEAANGILVFNKQTLAGQGTLHNFLPNGFSPHWWLPFVWVEGG